MKKKKQPTLFGDLDEFTEWKKEWQDMPEFVQNNEKPYQQIIISFDSAEDVQDFAKLIEQPLTGRTKSVLYPRVEKERPSDYIYKDEA